VSESRAPTASARLYERALKILPGGVSRNTVLRKPHPLYADYATGCRVTDIEGVERIDFANNMASLIHGHAHPAIVDAVTKQIQRGNAFTLATEVEVRFAEHMCGRSEGFELLRFVNSGTEAVMSALRLARAATGRDRIVKFEGCYHGHSDSLLIKAGSGALTLGVPSSPGVPAGLAEHTVTLAYNDIEAVQSAFAALGDEIACVIVEPVAGNMNMVPPVPGFLQALREECTKAGSILILDEVMTGFRVAKGGAQAMFGIEPDLTTLGKIVGGGMPAAAFGGRADIMASIAPDGPVYQAGTLSGNPVAMAAGLATLELIDEPGFYESLSAKTKSLVEGLATAAADAGISLATECEGGMVGLVFTDATSVRSFDQVAAADVERFKKFFHGMLNEGIYFAPSAFEAGFVSAAHSDGDINVTIDAAKNVFATL